MNLIQKYFSPHPDPKFNEEFQEYGGFFNSGLKCFIEAHKVSNEELRISYCSTSEYRNKPIYENGINVGHVRQSKPHTIITNEASFTLCGVKRVVRYQPVKKWRAETIKIKRSIWPWSNKLIVKIETSELKLWIKCTSIIPYSYKSITENLEEDKVLEEPENETDTSYQENDYTKGSNYNPLPKSPPPLDLTPPVKHNYVNYTSTIPDQLDVFPIYRCPKFGCIVRTHSLGRLNRRGYKEEEFQKAINAYFGNEFTVSGRVILNTGEQTRPFEPDIALIDKSNPSLKIDIEIDEPYAGYTRKPTHCKGDDTQRDIYFSDRGWIVLRFSELQVHTREKQCLAYIARIIQSVKPSFQIPSELAEYGAVGKQQLWDLLTAQKWERDKRREEYLGIDNFGELVEDQIMVNNDFDEQYALEESEVNPTRIGVPENRRTVPRNPFIPRDNRIRFYSENHQYTIDGVPAPSVSTVVSKFFPEFDPDDAIRSMRNGANWNSQHRYWGLSDDEIKSLWRLNKEEASRKGTFLHEQIEKFYLGIDYNRTDEFHLFEQFHLNHLHIEPYRSEWRIFDEDHHIAGTIDMVSRNGNQFEIYDWKRSENVINPITGEPKNPTRWTETGVGRLSDIYDTSYNRYCLQQSLYRCILESKYGLNISNMYLVILHPNYDRYYKVPVPYMYDEAIYILESLRSN